MSFTLFNDHPVIREAYDKGFADWDLHFSSDWKIRPRNPYEKETDQWYSWNMGWNANESGVDDPEPTLTPSELDFIPCLEKVDANSIWGAAVHNALKDLDTYKFRRLVSELKSQNEDSPEIMRNILGPDCHSQLLNL